MYLIWLIAITSGAMLVYGIVELYWAFTAKTWPTAKGKVIESFLRASPGNQTEKVPFITYEYPAGGKLRRSRRLSWELFAVYKNFDAEQLELEYPAGKEVLVHRHSFFKGIAVLDPQKIRYRQYVFFIVLSLFLFISSGVAALYPGVSPLFEVIRFFSGE